MKRLTWTVVLMAALALLGCGDKPADEPQSIEVTIGEEDAYQTAVFAQQRAEWEVLAEQGDARSQRQLGIMYYLGQGIDIDYATASKWLSKAAALKHFHIIQRHYAWNPTILRSIIILVLH